MLKSTIKLLSCPSCFKEGSREESLTLFQNQKNITYGEDLEIINGQLKCNFCEEVYPILAGIAIVMTDANEVILSHAKGISACVSREDIPKKIRKEFYEIIESLEDEHIEEDLESKRVVSLYLMTHYLKAKDFLTICDRYSIDPLIQSLIKQYWQSGPFQQIETWMNPFSNHQILELGCGVGGLVRQIKDHSAFYLGVDSSFLSLVLARHLNLGMPCPFELKLPFDLLLGSLSEPFKFDSQTLKNADFIMGNIEEVQVKGGFWDNVIALNAIDMLDAPETLPELQYYLLKNKGVAIQTSPYVWHEKVSLHLKELFKEHDLPFKSSHEAVRIMYETIGFKTLEEKKHIQWLFFKHLRQLEIYSVHALMVEKV